MREDRTYEINYNDAFEEALETAKKCFNIQEHDIAKGYIKCTIRASLRSWGENILITIIKIDSSRTTITIESSASTQLFDWGKSRENINNFFNIFEQNLR